MVSDSSGNAISGATIFYGDALPDLPNRASTQSDNGGSFELKSFPASTQRISAYHPDYSAHTVEIAAHFDRSTPVRIALSSGGSVTGQVWLPDEAIDKVGVEISRGFGETAMARGELATDGTYLLETIPKGEAEVWLAMYYNGGNMRRILSRPVVVENGRTTVVDFDVQEATGIIEGAVTANEADLSPLAVMLTIETEYHTEYSMAVIGDMGVYRLERVPPGRGVLQVMLRDGLAGHVEVNVAEGETLYQDINIPN